MGHDASGGQGTDAIVGIGEQGPQEGDRLCVCAPCDQRRGPCAQIVALGRHAEPRHLHGTRIIPGEHRLKDPGPDIAHVVPGPQAERETELRPAP